MIDNIKDFIEEKHYNYTFNEWLKKQIFARDKEIEKLYSIIKEVREYINKIPTQPVIRVFKKELLEILDKENNNV